MTKNTPTSWYRKTPEQVLMDKERSIERRLKGCKGCKHISYDAVGERIYAACARGRKVGRKGKCTLFRETE